MEQTARDSDCPSFGIDYDQNSQDCQECSHGGNCYAIKFLRHHKYRETDIEFLFPIFLTLKVEAYEKFGNDINKTNRFITQRLNKAKEFRARELRSQAREQRLEAERREAEANALEHSGPKANRFPWKWMREVAKATRGAAILVQLITLTKEIAKKKDSDRLLEELVASDRYKRDDLGEHYVDKNGKAGIWPFVLIQMDYGLAMAARSWKKRKVQRILNLACEDGVFKDMGRIGAHGQTIYCLGAWMGFKGKVDIKWNFTDTEHWVKVFGDFKCS